VHLPSFLRTLKFVYLVRQKHAIGFTVTYYEKFRALFWWQDDGTGVIIRKFIGINHNYFSINCNYEH
jgi:hypothetical protein